jgi:hypothetical protein
VTAPIDQPDWQNPQTGMVITTRLLNNVSIAPTFGQQFADLSAYSSYTIWLTTASVNGAQFDISDPASGKALFSLTTPPDAIGTQGVPIQAPITTKGIQITNNGTETLHISLEVSTRTVTGRPTAFSVVDEDNLSRANAAVAGTVDLGYGHGYGVAWCWLGVSGATVTGDFAIRSGQDVYDIADTTEMHNNPFGGRSVYKEVIVPRGTWALEFHTQTGGTAALNAHFTYAG